MRRSPLAPAVLAVAALVPLLLTGCSEVQDAAGTAASNAATQARDDATNSVKNAAQQQAEQTVCQLTKGSGALADGALSDEDRVLVASAATLADSVDLPGEYTKPLAVLGSTSSAKEDVSTAIDKLRTACGA